MPDFKAALALVLRYEGGNVDDPRDPGGRTSHGVTQDTFNAYCRRCGATPRDVFTITPAEIEAVYRDHYAAVIRFDELPDGVGFAVFDAAVNSGPRRAVQWLQQAVGVSVDGVIGPKTVAAAKLCRSDLVVGAICDERMAFLRGRETWPTFGKGWTTRVADVRSRALEMARAPASAPVHIDNLPKPPPAGLGARLAFLFTGRHA